MKNNFITKIIGASLSIAMMIGVGAGVNFAKEAKPADATVTYAWQKMTSKSEFANGAVILVTQGSYYLDASQAATSNTPRMASLSLSNGLPTLAANDAKCFTVTTFNNTGLRMYGPGGTNYLYTNTSNNAARIGTSSTNGSLWTIEDGPSSGEFYLKSNASTARYLSRYGTTDFRSYTNTDTNANLILYKLVESSSNEPTITFSENEINGVEGEEFSFTYETANLTEDITWAPASENTNIINYSVNTQTKTVSGTMLNIGSVTLTATSGSASASVDFTVSEHIVHSLFTVDTTSKVNKSGDTITGSTATYSQTFGTAKQATAGNTLTLSITGLTKKVHINKLVLSMRSNKSAGAGSISVKIDNSAPSFIAGVSANTGSGFNTFGDNNSYSDSYKNVTWDNLTYTAISSIEIKIYCIDTNSLYCESYDIFFEEEENVDVVTAFTVSPNTWSGFDSSTLNVSDFTLSITKNGAAGTASDYTFQGIGYMNGDLFVPRVANFSSGHPTAADTRLCWKANYPTTAGGSTYLYAYVTLTVQADVVSTVAVSGNLNKTLYTTGDEWDTDGLTVTATYTSSASVNVTNSSTFSFYSDAAMANEISAPADLGCGADQSIYVKATCSNVSNETGYEQTVSIVKVSRVTFDATTDIGADSPNPGVSKNGITIATESGNGTFTRNDNYRIYSGREMTITSTTENIVEIKFSCTSGKYNALTGEGYTASGSYGVWTGDASSVTLTSSGEQSRITKVVITVASALHDVEATLSTTTALSYHYEHEGNVYTYTNVAIRFGSLMEQSLWNSLDSESLIAGYGVLITDDSVVGENDDIADAYDLAELSPEITDHYMSKVEKATPSAATDKQKSDAGVTGDYYIWNLYLTVEEANFETTYVAGAYIKLVTGDVVFMNKASFSVKSLAADYLANRNCNQQTAGGSLYNLAHFGE